MKFLLLAITFSMLLHIHAELKRNYLLIYIFKPLTTVLIGSLALTHGASGLYKNLIIIGFLFSLFGDIFLMLRRQKFTMGLVSFLIAHFFYAYAFSLGLIKLHFTFLIFLLMIGILIYNYLYNFLQEMKIPVLIYLLAIVLMAWMSFERSSLLDSEKGLYALIGASFFMISDTILAIDKFKIQHIIFTPLIMTTYFMAQTFIALSV